jgi:hypothetical protein
VARFGLAIRDFQGLERDTAAIVGMYEIERLLEVKQAPALIYESRRSLSNYVPLNLLNNHEL